jgi:hypothetical protein
VITGLILVLIIGFGFLLAFVMRQIEFIDFFAVPYTAGRAWLLDGISPYDSAINKLASETIKGSNFSAVLPSELFFSQPLLNLFFFLPFSLIPFEISRVMWVTLSSVFAGLSIHFILKLLSWNTSPIRNILIILLGIFWFPGIIGIISGHIVFVILFLMLLAVVLIKNEQDTAAGFLLSLTFGSFALTGLILIFLTIWAIARKRWSLILAYFSGIAFLIIISLLLLPNWHLDWLNIQINIFQNTSIIKTPLMDISNLLPGISKFLTVFLHALMGTILLIQWITGSRKTGKMFLWKLFFVYVIGYLFYYQANIIHLSFLLPAGFIFLKYLAKRYGLAGQILSWSLLLIITAGSWLIFLPNIKFSEIPGSHILSIGMPIFVLIGLLWSKWWVDSKPEFNAEKY